MEEIVEDENSIIIYPNPSQGEINIKYNNDNIDKDIEEYIMYHEILVEDVYFSEEEDNVAISISEVDLNNGSPKLGDMIARNPKNHKDQWLVAKQYFEDNFEEIC